MRNILFAGLLLFSKRNAKQIVIKECGIKLFMSYYGCGRFCEIIIMTFNILFAKFWERLKRNEFCGIIRRESLEKNLLQVVI